MKYSKIIKKSIKESIRNITSLGHIDFSVILFLILLFIDIRIALILALGILIIQVIGVLIKLLFNKKRPNKQNYTNILEKIDAGSFPSIHSARSILIALVLYPLFSHIAVTMVLFALAILVGYSRMHLKKHYLIDVIGGYLLGLIAWYLAGLVF